MWLEYRMRLGRGRGQIMKDFTSCIKEFGLKPKQMKVFKQESEKR